MQPKMDAYYFGLTQDNRLLYTFFFQELHAVCQSMQQRLMELISKLPNDSLFEELLRINDDLNNLFLRYSRWEKNRGAGLKNVSAVLAKVIPPHSATTKPPLEASDSLIDFDDDINKDLEKISKLTT